jgi:hypothetical protein
MWVRGTNLRYLALSMRLMNVCVTQSHMDEERACAARSSVFVSERRPVAKDGAESSAVAIRVASMACSGPAWHGS